MKIYVSSVVLENVNCDYFIFYVFVLGGFGSVLLNSMRQIESLCQKNTVSEIPLILGRDFAGTVVGKGSAVTEFDIGDEVYGVVKPQNRGCHAEFALTYDKLVSYQNNQVIYHVYSQLCFFFYICFLYSWKFFTHCKSYQFHSPIILLLFGNH